MHLSDNIKLIRLLSGKKQEDFAKLMDVTRSMQGSYENGKAKPGMLYFNKLMNLTGISYDDLSKKKLLEKEIKINVENVYNEEASAMELRDDGIPYQAGEKKDNLTMNALLSIAKSTELLAKANSDLAKNALEMTMILKVNSGVTKEIQQDVAARFEDALFAVSKVLPDKNLKTADDFFAALRRHFYDIPANRQQTGTPVG